MPDENPAGKPLGDESPERPEDKPAHTSTKDTSTKEPDGKAPDPKMLGLIETQVKQFANMDLSSFADMTKQNPLYREILVTDRHGRLGRERHHLPRRQRRPRRDRSRRNSDFRRGTD